MDSLKGLLGGDSEVDAGLVLRGRAGAAMRRELREAEARQRRRIAEAGLRRAQAMAKLGHVVTAADGAFESWSDSLPALIGVPPERTPRSTREWITLLHPEEGPRLREESIRAARGRERREISYRLR